MPPPSPGRIHDLPIKILYSLDTSSQSYVTVLPERHSVYVYPRAQQDETALGSCYLKAAARGICFASPECIPNSTTLDFSVYNLDPTLKPLATRAFPHPAQVGTDDSWTGKGFLSWVLGEAATGKTLVKGKLVREHEFSSLAFNDQGGLEGLMAAASRAENGSSEDRDGKGWGLEVAISLKMVNPEGKDEYKGRREFEDMMRRGTGLASVSSPVSIATSTPRPHQDPIRRNPPSGGGSVSRIAGPPPFQHSSSTSSISARPSPSAQPIRPPSSASRPSLPSSLPPSSMPMGPSSSSGAGPSTIRQPAHSNGHSSSTNSATRVQSREVTPPPLPQRRSPPPSTPSREKLAALLRTDEKMSPSMAKHLAQNPVLLKLLKAVPPTALNFSQTHHSATNGDKDSPESNEATTPTPSAPNVPSSSKQKQSISVFSTEGCCNCGAKESELWRTKTMKDGTKKKVCNACGLYFNKHKRMRPAELWGTNATDDSANHHPEKRIKLDDHPVRHSPRLHRGPSEHPPPVPSIAESPRRRRVTKPVPQPSPRMATRASSRQEGGMDPKALDFSDSLFSPSTMFGTSPANPASVPGQTLSSHPNHALGVDNSLGGLGMGGEDIDIEALLNQMVAADGQNGFSLDELFASASTENGDNLLDLLSSWDEGKDGLNSTGI